MVFQAARYDIRYPVIQLYFSGTALPAAAKRLFQDRSSNSRVI